MGHKTKNKNGYLEDVVSCSECGAIICRVAYMDSGDGRKNRDNVWDKEYKKNIKNKNNPEDAICDRCLIKEESDGRRQETRTNN